MGTRQYLDRELRKDTIVDWLEGAVTPYTIAAVARGLKLSKSPWLRELLDELVQEGRIVTEPVILRNGVTGNGYRIRRPHHTQTT